MLGVTGIAVLKSEVKGLGWEKGGLHNEAMLVLVNLLCKLLDVLRGCTLRNK